VPPERPVSGLLGSGIVKHWRYVMRRFLILATVLGGGLSTACGDSTGPGAIFGTYELVSIDGEVLPILGVPILVEGSIELRSDMAYLKR
jgi:hypothetical protein